MIGNLGNKDRRGRQARIGHHGRNPRISRTGGVSLRHAVRVGRVGLAVNSRHGLRLSSALGRGTQVATQNGRFILRGRYGKGPVKFNLSKSGVSASLASDIGRLNLTHPGRSSAKLFGVQVRGRKAASINVGVLAAAAVVAIIKMAVVLLVVSLKALVWLAAAFVETARALLERWQAARSKQAFQARLPSWKSSRPFWIRVCCRTMPAGCNCSGMCCCIAGALIPISFGFDWKRSAAVFGQSVGPGNCCR